MGKWSDLAQQLPDGAVPLANSAVSAISPPIGAIGTGDRSQRLFANVADLRFAQPPVSARDWCKVWQQ